MCCSTYIKCAIKIKCNRIFDRYFDKINNHQISSLISYLNESITYNNLYAFRKLIKNFDTITRLLENKCKMVKNYNESGTKTSYFLAILESCKCNQNFTDYMNSLVAKYLSIINSTPDKNKQLLKIEIIPTLYKPKIQLNRFQDVQFMKYQQRSHKKYNNKQKLHNFSQPHQLNVRR